MAGAPFPRPAGEPVGGSSMGARCQGVFAALRRPLSPRGGALLVAVRIAGKGLSEYYHGERGAGQRVV